MSHFGILLPIFLFGIGWFTFLVSIKEAKTLRTVIGIDLGTTSSSVAVYMNGRVEIIPNELGNRVTPSFVAFTDSERLIGEAAKYQATINPTRTIFDVKRLIGRRFGDKEVQGDLKLVPYRIVNGDGKPYIQVDVWGKTRLFSPEEISAMILTKMKATAEAFLGKKIKNAVIAVPAYFNDAQRQATIDAGMIAGLNVARIINEPTAAAFAYALHKERGIKNILVFDLGGGSFDASILSIRFGIFEVLTTNGDNHLGGEDFTQRIMDYFVKLIKKKRGEDISKDIRVLENLRREAERAKRALSSQHQVRVEIESPFGDVDFSESLSRARFEELNDDLFKKTIGHVKNAMEDAELEKHQIDEIVLGGGSTRIPKIQQLLGDFFDGKELNMDVNPDVGVAFGAAVQGAILSGKGGDETSDMSLWDVVPFTLDVQTNGQEIINLFPRNAYIPNWEVLAFTNSSWVRQQTNVSINVYERERGLAEDCRLIGTYVLSGIPPAPRFVFVMGASEIEVEFIVDDNGILDAKPRGNSKITITRKGRLSQEEIKHMVWKAKEFAEEEKKVKEKIDARNALETFLCNMKSQNYVDKVRKLGSDEKEKLETATKEALKWLDDNHSTEKKDFDEKLNEVEAVFNSITDSVYQRSGF